MSDRQQNAILVIDDDPESLRLVQPALEISGYQVYTATSGEEGIKLYRTHRREIKLVLLDYMMPEMTGDVVLEWLRMENPYVRVLLVTGHGDEVVRKMLALGICGYIKKPYRLAGFVDKVRDALDGPVAPASASPTHA